MKSITVIHSGAIGDLIQILPSLHALRRAYPGVRITLVGHPERVALAILAGAADAAVDLETAGLWRLAGDPAAALPPVIAGADLVLDFLGTVAAALARRTGGQAASGTLPRVIQFAPLPPPGWNRPACNWIGEQVVKSLGSFEEGGCGAPTLQGQGNSITDGPPLIPVPPAAMAAARELLLSRGITGPFMAIHPGSGSLRKNWPIDRFTAIAEQLRSKGRTVVWLAGPAELERETLQLPSPRRGRGAGGEGEIQTRNAELGTRNAGNGNNRNGNRDGREVVLQDLTLVQVAAVLALADGYLGNDSGITQVAAAVRGAGGRATPTVALFGPTDPQVWAPRGPHVKVIRSPDGSMNAITVDAVGAAGGGWAR